MKTDKIVKTEKKKKFFEEILLLFLIIFGAIYLLQANVLKTNGEQHFVDLAQSFLQGKLYFLPSVRESDLSLPYMGKHYLMLGPLPAVILMPFVAIWGLAFQQGYLQFIFIAVSAFLLYKIAKKITGTTISSLWLSFGFIFSTAYIGLAVLPWSWYYAQVTSTMLILFAIYEFLKINEAEQKDALNLKKYLFIGLSIGLATGVRFYIFTIVVFFALELLFSNKNIKAKIFSFFALCIPIVLCNLLLFLYNFYRFHNIFDTGYASQGTPPIPVIAETMKYGLWSIIHIPMQLYFLLLKGPDPIFIPKTLMLKFPYFTTDPNGMSIIFTSPMFLWILKAPFKNKHVLFAGIACCLVEFSVFGYFGSGFRQFGYRYAIEYYPFLFLILLYAVKQNLSPILKTVIVLSCCFNLLLLLSYP